MLFTFNKTGASPEFYNFEISDSTFAIGSFIATWPLAWLVLYFNVGSLEASELWADMWSSGFLNFIACNIVLYIKSWCLLIVNIIFGIFGFLF